MDAVRTPQLTTLLVFGLTASVLAGCAGTSLPGTNESLDWKLVGFAVADKEKTGWKGVKDDETWRLIYAKPGATPQTWTEKVEVTQFPIAITLGSPVRWHPESVMNAEKARLGRTSAALAA
jgi:hypothetical protein